MPLSSNSVVTTSMPSSLGVTYDERKPAPRVLASFFTFLERRAVDHPAAAFAVGLVQDHVAELVAVGRERRASGRVFPAANAPYMALPDLLDAVAAEIDAHGVDHRLLARLGGEVRDRGIGVDVEQVRAESSNESPPSGSGKPPSIGITNGL